jgi:hypothetical protein
MEGWKVESVFCGEYVAFVAKPFYLRLTRLGAKDLGTITLRVLPLEARGNLESLFVILLSCIIFLQNELKLYIIFWPRALRHVHSLIHGTESTFS